MLTSDTREQAINAIIRIERHNMKQELLPVVAVMLETLGRKIRRNKLRSFDASKLMKEQSIKVRNGDLEVTE